MTSSQVWNPTQYVRDAGFVAALGAPLVDVLAPRAGERVLDLGCGDGALTQRLVEAGCTVVGVDASAEQVEAARARGLDAYVADAAELSYEGAFDAVFSNATLHWVPDFRATARGVFRALVPGGRFVTECGGAGNLRAIRAALHAALARRGIDPTAHDPWTFRTPDEAREQLTEAGFVVHVAELFPRPTPVPAGMEAWLAMFAQSFFAALPELERPRYVQEVAAALAPTLRDDAGRWTADYARLRFVAVKPAR
ncbi:MAG: class I SAM-dependent methyltransferase [Polyangiales bacterium]